MKKVSYFHGHLFDYGLESIFKSSVLLIQLTVFPAEGKKV